MSNSNNQGIKDKTISGLFWPLSGMHLAVCRKMWSRRRDIYCIHSACQTVRPV